MKYSRDPGRPVEQCDTDAGKDFFLGNLDVLGVLLLGVSVQLGLGQTEQVVDEVGVALDVDMLDQSEVSIECGCGVDQSQLTWSSVQAEMPQ